MQLLREIKVRFLLPQGEPHGKDYLYLTESSTAAVGRVINSFGRSDQPNHRYSNKAVITAIKEYKMYDMPYSIVIGGKMTTIYKIKIYEFAPEKDLVKRFSDMVDETISYTGNTTITVGSTSTTSIPYQPMSWGTSTTSDHTYISPYNPYPHPYFTQPPIYTTHNLPIITMNNKEETTMNFNNMFSRLNLEVAQVNDKRIAFSLYGVAVGDSKGFTAYTADGQAKDVTDFIFPDAPLFKMPVAIKHIKVGDLIVHRSNFMHVKDVKEDGNLIVINMLESKEETVIPIKNAFGFNYYTKVVAPFGTMMADADEDNPFGKMLPLMALTQNGGDNTMLMMMLMGGEFGFNLDDEMGGLMPFMMMNMFNGQAANGNNQMDGMMQMMFMSKLMKSFEE